MHMLRGMSEVTLNGKLRNDCTSGTLKVAVIEDKIRECHLRWFKHIFGQLEIALLQKIEVLAEGRGL